MGLVIVLYFDMIYEYSCFSSEQCAFVRFILVSLIIYHM